MTRLNQINRKNQMKEKLTQRDLFECEYIHKHMPDDVYREAKKSLEDNRNGLTYDDEGVNAAFYNWIEGMEW